jgi:hypothetical protein
MNNTKDNPFAQDSLPIGTVIEWEGKKIEVVEHEGIGCEGCVFLSTSICLNLEAKCYPVGRDKSTDGKHRKYILINEQQEEEEMKQEIKINSEVEVISGDRPDAIGFVCKVIKVLPKRDKPYYVEGEYFIHWFSEKEIELLVREEIKQEPEGHVHAKLIIEYGKVALTTKEPWLEYESQPNHPEAMVWHQCNSQLLFAPDTRYRRKPKTILINGYEVPEHLRVAPEEGTVVFAVSILDATPTFKFVYTGSCVTHVRMLNSGVLHLTSEAAQLHAKALLSFTTVPEQL